MSRLIICAKADKAPSGASSEIVHWKIFEVQVRSFLPRNPDLNPWLKEFFPDKLRALYILVNRNPRALRGASHSYSYAWSRVNWYRMMRASTFLWTRRHVYKGGPDALIATKAKSFYLRMQIPHNLVPQILIQGNGGGRFDYTFAIFFVGCANGSAWQSFKAMFKKTMFTLCWSSPPQPKRQ